MTADCPTVTVVLPTYNDAAHLRRAIGSVVGQTTPAWELLVVDDASTDETEQVVATHDDPRIRYLRLPANTGVAVAQNAGIDEARGDLVVFLHSDDELFPAKLARQVELLQRVPATVGAVQSAIEIVWDDHTERWPPTLDGVGPGDVLAYRVQVHMSGLMVRRSVAASVRFDPHLRGAEDRDFCIRLLQTTTLAFDPELLSRVTKSPSRLGSQNKAPIYEYLFEKHRAEIEGDRRVHADWDFRIARAHARAGDLRAARASLTRSLQIFPRQPLRWPLWLASFGGDAVLRSAFRSYAAVSRARHRARRVRRSRP